MRGRLRGALSGASCSGFTTGAVAAGAALAEGSDSARVAPTMAAAPAAVDRVIVAGAVTTGATAAVVRCAALIFVETGSLPPPARGRNISSPAIATAATPTDAYNTVRFLRARSGESACTGAIVDRQSPSAASSLAT